MDFKQATSFCNQYNAKAMPAITIRGVSPHLHQQLKRRAEAHNRSLNGEVLQLLEEAVLGSAGGERPRHALIEKLRREQQRTPAWKVSAEEMKRAMREDLL